MYDKTLFGDHKSSLINKIYTRYPSLNQLFFVVIIFTSFVICLYAPVIYDLVVFWWGSQEYSYGLLMPIISGYIVYQQRHELYLATCENRFFGLTLFALSYVLYMTAIVADVDTIKRYALILSLASVVVYMGSWLLLRRLAYPFILLIFSLPLPYLLGALLTTKMQLISSDLGVLLIRLMGLPVFQDGNIINMSGFQMLVAEACSGLRYLYPLMAISLIITYFYRGNILFKFLLFMLAIPITIIMNSLRIAITGLLIKVYGQGAAEGFLHDFEGWLVFAVAFLLLIAGVWLISSLRNIGSTDKIIFANRFDFHVTHSSYVKPEPVSIKSSLVFGAILIICTCGALVLYRNLPSDFIPKREDFSTFPFQLATREIYPKILSKSVKEVLRADDYFIADYKKTGLVDINLYIVYYKNQKDGRALHSPKSCLPGGGWKIQESSTVNLDQFGGDGKANRVIIEQGGQRLLVYYWIHQNAHNYANEFLARFSLLKQSITTGRTDGALIRVIRPIVDVDKGDVDKGDEIIMAEHDMNEFIRSFIPLLSLYLPS